MNAIIEVNQFNHVGLMTKYRGILNNSSYWHQVVVENVEGLDRDAVLKTLMKFCQPAHFIPVQYASSKNTASFLLKSCGAAIQKLCSNNLIVINPHNNKKPFKITIKLCYASSNDLKINIHLNLTNVLNKRFNQDTGILNLDDFAKDPELEEYCALSQPKLFFYVLHLVRHFAIKMVKLANNEIESLNAIEALENTKNNISFDLRNNCIKEITELDYFKHLNVTELWLDGNPICDRFSEITYGKSIKEHLKKLEKLDGVGVHTQQFPPFRRNFLCDLTGYDLVDQFLEHYFTLYDRHNRSILEETYHKHALFSLTSMYIPSQITSSTAQLIPYKKFARNLKQMSDFSKNAQSLFTGPQTIIKVLNTLPVTEHDPFSFTADLIMHTEDIAVLVVSGIFREFSASLLESDRLLGFTRTFVLLPGRNGQYSIVNEMLNVTNATTSQAARAFKQARVPTLQCMHMPRAQYGKEFDDMSEALKAITGLETDWARKCLTECNNDLSEALKLFIDLYKKNKIPKLAFIGEEKRHETSMQVENGVKSTLPIITQTIGHSISLDSSEPMTNLWNRQYNPELDVSPDESVTPDKKRKKKRLRNSRRRGNVHSTENKV